MGGCRPLLPPMYFNVTVPLNNSALCHYFQSLANYCMQQKKWAPQVQHRWNLGVSVQKLIRCLLSDGGQKCLDTLLFPPLYREKWNSMWKAVYPLVTKWFGKGGMKKQCCLQWMTVNWRENKSIRKLSDCWPFSLCKSMENIYFLTSSDLPKL